MHKWMNPPKPYKNLMYHLDDVKVVPEPLGVVLIIGPYNYPIKLISIPLHGAIAAGNCVIMKPSHLTPQCSTLLAKLVPKYLDKECFKVVLADPSETKLLLKQKFDYIFATCSAATGRVVAEAAARQMTPTSIQMGSKCPVYLDENLGGNFDRAVTKVIFNKYVNLGQMCMAPDYVICTPKAQQQLVAIFEKTLKSLHGENVQKSTTLGRLVNLEHVKRLENLIRSTNGKIVYGGTVDKKDLWVSPTLVVDVHPDDILMKEEIFGPILPVVVVDGPAKAVELIRTRGKPLAVYVFSNDRATQDLFVTQTSSGGVSINDCITYSAIEDLPFGGVGESGIGPKYHGQSTFLTFTNQKGVHRKKLNWFNQYTDRVKYPPLNGFKLFVAKYFLKAKSTREKSIAVFSILTVFYSVVFSPVIILFIAWILGGTSTEN
ncbi:aldehyde dehydrogenase, dimeric NADP-preferring-like [Neocloeon triangulifer]|uniref:aldehyde dehydrogenase, dimeric NADP-preferring-like n=1 Tax=Neocloeon triangulifer TaxID=2078957 RepID=UPI00286F005C|nr:aldehyde dehydrogenase, dimeric NADP-preferring-like [Neocloeon triangulifer]